MVTEPGGVDVDWARARVKMFVAKTRRVVVYMVDYVVLW